ncbi:MAG: hypothetical protein NZ580_06140 [Bacteroidia bacterium]|nr:hypothetical protein [Bacteroidia bacterium]
MSSTEAFSVHLVRECAHRVKYTIDLPKPLSLPQYHKLAQQFSAQLTDAWLPDGHLLFHLRLPEGKGTLSSSATTPTLHVVLSKKEAAALLQAILEALQAALSE